MSFHIDMELLVTLVGDKPVLWNKTLGCYRNKQMNYAAWTGICEILNEDYAAMSDKGKHDYGKCVIKKWNNCRDNWIKCYNKIKKCKTNAEVENIRKYKFYDKMEYLIVTVGRKTSDPTASPEIHNNKSKPTSSDSNRYKYSHKKRKSKDPAGSKFETLNSTAEKGDRGRVMSFFRSIAPTIENFTDEDIVEFQYEVIKSMRHISRRSRTSNFLESRSPHACPCSTSSAPSPAIYQMGSEEDVRNPLKQSPLSERSMSPVSLMSFGSNME